MAWAVLSVTETRISVQHLPAGEISCKCHTTRYGKKKKLDSVSGLPTGNLSPKQSQRRQQDTKKEIQEDVMKEIKSKRK